MGGWQWTGLRREDTIPQPTPSHRDSLRALLRRPANDVAASLQHQLPTLQGMGPHATAHCRI